MLTAINLDNQSRFYADEVGNVRRYRVLAPKLEAAKLAILQESP